MSERRGYLLIAGAACCWGASAALGRAMFIGRFAAVAALDPLILTQARITLAAMILLPALLALRGRGVLLPPGAAARAVVLGVVGMSSSNYFYYIAIDRTNVTTAIILQYTAPIFVLVYLVARGRQRATPKRVSAVALAVIGIALVLGLGQLRLDTIGVIAAMVAALAFAYYNIAGEQLSARVDPVLVSLYMLLGAAVFCLLVNPPWRWQTHYSAGQWEFLLLFSLLATLFPTLLYIGGLKYLDPTRAVITSCLEPVAGILLAASFLGEHVGWLQILGVACVLSAIVLAATAASAAQAATPL